MPTPSPWQSLTGSKVSSLFARGNELFRQGVLANRLGAVAMFYKPNSGWLCQATPHKQWKRFGTSWQAARIMRRRRLTLGLRIGFSGSTLTRRASSVRWLIEMATMYGLSLRWASAKKSWAGTTRRWHPFRRQFTHSHSTQRRTTTQAVR